MARKMLDPPFPDMLCLIQLNYLSFVFLQVTGLLTDALSVLCVGLLVCVLLFKDALLYRPLMYGSMALEHILLKKAALLNLCRNTFVQF